MVRRGRLADTHDEGADQNADAATEFWVQNNPWAALAIGAGVGILVGALIMRVSQAAPPDDPEPYV